MTNTVYSKYVKKLKKNGISAAELIYKAYLLF